MARSAARIGNRRPFSMAFGVGGVNGSNDLFARTVARSAFFVARPRFHAGLTL
jgi:hypothetical protein